MCKYSAFKASPYRNCNMQVVCFQKGSEQPLKCVSIPLVNFIEGALKKLQCVSTLIAKGPPTATGICKHLAFDGAPNRNYNVTFHAFKEALTAIAICKYLTFKGAPNSNCNV